MRVVPRGLDGGLLLVLTSQTGSGGDLLGLADTLVRDIRPLLAGSEPS